MTNLGRNDMTQPVDRMVRDGKGRFTGSLAGEQNGSLDPTQSGGPVDLPAAPPVAAVPLDVYGRPNYCAPGEWYWAIRPHVPTHRDAKSDSEYNATGTWINPPAPRNPRQIADFWEGCDHFGWPSDPQNLTLEYHLKWRGYREWARDLYMWETGIGIDDLKRNWRGELSKRKVQEFTDQCQEWEKTFPNPLKTETAGDIIVAIQMYTDARILDARKGRDPGSPESATVQVGHYWQTRTGQSPRQLVESCHLARMHDVTGPKLDWEYSKNSTRPMWGPKPRWQLTPWVGYRQYITAPNPWKPLNRDDFPGAVG